jgi:signal transduction histidine kinase/DNA-binding response OmpR family regulator/GGDEF domain-containing protein
MLTEPACEPLSVLLIEDNPADARLIELALAEATSPPFRVEQVATLAAGLARLSAGDLHAVLLDLSLPDSQGLATFLRVQQQAPAIPILILTGRQDERLAVEAVQRGAQDYLAKGSVIVLHHFLIRAIRCAVERKRAEREFIRLASFPEQHPDPILESRPDGTLTYLNPSARARFPELSGADRHHPLLAGLDHVVATLTERRLASLVREVAVGERIYEQHVSYVPTAQVARSYLVDVTERKQIQRQAEEFIGTVSHELRTPLATMREFTDILADGLAGAMSPSQQEYLGIIRQNNDRLSRIVDELLDLQKLEAGRLFLHRQFLEAQPLIRQVVDSLRPLADARRLRLAVEVPERPVGLFADSDKLVQVLTNLVSNAIKFTPEFGHVTVAVRELDDAIQFAVRDTGIGIDAQDLPRLFEKFQQLHRQPERKGAMGTGLGLAISKRLVELHGGRIWAESQASVGSTFTFALPIYHPEEIFTEYLKAGIAQAREQQGSFSVLAIAIAELEALKAHAPPEAVAAALNTLEELVKTAVRQRQGDVVVRWQRGEAILVLAQMDRAGCEVMIQRIRQLIADQAPWGSMEPPVTVLTSSATYPEEAANEQELLRIAQQRLARLVSPRLRLLVVDDEPKIRRFLKQTLELHGFEVDTAASGPDALERLKTHLADLILLDLLMPVMDGYEVYHLLKENPSTRDIPVLIVTAKGERTDRLLGIEGPSYNHLSKPFEVDELLAKVRQALAAAQQTPAP